MNDQVIWSLRVKAEPVVPEQGGYRVVWTLQRGMIDEPVDAETRDSLTLMDWLDQRPQLARLLPRQVFDADQVAYWRTGENGTPLRVPPEERRA